MKPLTVFAASTDTCGYNPAAAPSPNGGTTVFNENTVTRAIAFYGTGLSGHVGVFSNDETGLFIGNGGSPSSASLEAKPAVLGSGKDPAGRDYAPEIFVTDVTSNPNSTAGDWEHGGIAANAGNPPWATALYGSWTNTLGQHPVVKNGWNLGPDADPIPATDAFGGSTTSFNEGYSAEVAWNIAGLKAYDPVTGTYQPLQPGHQYRFQSLTHDADQNKGYGDVGEVCTTLSFPSPNLSITKTADAAEVNAGDQIGFTVEIKNTGNQDAINALLNDPLPAGSGTGVTWSIDTSTGTPTKFVLSGSKGSQRLGLASSTIPVGADYKVHITATTSSSECSKYDNTATLTSDGNNPPPVSASEKCVKPGVQIVKTPDSAQVNAGDPIGFTLTVYNAGTGAATGVKLSDALPANAGLNWSIASQGAGWGGSCSIAAGTLTCGPVTVPAGTTQAGSSFTVHITSPTTAATGGDCPGSGVVDNTGKVTATNGDGGQSEASVCVFKPAIHVIKTADAPQVNAGEPIGFTVTVYNTGSGAATGTVLNDPLPTNAGLNWTIAGQGAGWNGTCSIAGGTLTCGPVTVPGNTSQAASTYTVHITSTTTSSTGGTCPGGSGVVNNTGYVTSTNGGSDQSTASTCVAKPQIQIVKTADAAQVTAGDTIGFTVVVYNSGSGDAKGVTLSDPLPTNAGLNWTIAGQGAGWNGSCSIAAGTLTCGPVTVPGNTTQGGSSYTVHITSPTTAATGGNCPNTGVVNNTATVSTSNAGSGQSSASTCVAKPSIQIIKTADATQVNAGDSIGFTVTVFNTGVGDAKGVKLSDPLPTNAGLNWQIDGQGAGWNGTCSISAGTLTCGGPNGVIVPFGTTQAGSSFTVHISSTTTAATGGTCPGGSGVVNNTGTVTTSNAGSAQSSASTCVAKPVIQIVKTADAAQVNAGDTIGFTITVFNTGTGDAKGATLSDALPTNPGLNWKIASQGAGWGGTCAISAGSLNCGPVTVPGGTTQAGSSYTVHITSTTTAATGGNCPNTGVVNNTGMVTTSNAGSGQSSASTCVSKPAIQIVKTADAAQVSAGDTIGFTLTVYNTGTGDAYGVNLNDPLPTNAGLNWRIASQGPGWNGSCSIAAGTLTCGPATVPGGTTQAGSVFTVHITSTTTAATGGTCPGGSGVVDNTGYVTTTNDGSGQSNASTCVAGPSIKILKQADAPQVNAGETIGFTVTVYNTGAGDAKGVNLNDPLPTNPGLNWQIAGQGVGWAGSCAINAGTLTCGPATVPGNTSAAASSFTVHITSTTTAATGGTCPGGSGVVSNTGYVTTTNDGSGQSTATTCVAAPNVQIVKTADAPQVTAGDQVGFTVTVFNPGTGDAKGVVLNDPLPTNAGLNWVIASQGAGWGGSCSIAAGTLTCGPVTVPAGTSQGASPFRVHITSTTTSATGGNCPNTGVVTNTGYVTSTNGGSGQSTAQTCVASAVIRILKTADAAQVSAGDQIGFTLTVYNTGTGDAKNVRLSDPLPTNAGLNWKIANQGGGWNGTCSIVAGTLNCGPVTVPGNTTIAGSSFAVHITSTTTAATGGTCPGGSGVVNNTGNVTTSNAGIDQSSASTCVAGATVHILKTADAAQVAAGSQIGFNLVVWNDGSGDAKGVTLSDPLPTNTGLNWKIASQGAGWNGTCSISNGSLNCGPVTVPAGTTQGASTYTVHLTSTTTPETGGDCNDTGIVNNTGTVTSTNAGSGQSSADVCVQGITDLAITKSGTPDDQEIKKYPGGTVTWTIVVTNKGPLDDTNVQVGDPMPFNATYVGVTTTKGTCTGGAILQCDLGTIKAGDSVTITLVTTPTDPGTITNTATVVGDLAESDYSNNTATASVKTHGPGRPNPACTAVLATPRQLYVGRTTTMHLTIEKIARGQKTVRVAGVQVRITGPGIAITTHASNSHGRIDQAITPRHKGIVYFKPLRQKKSCKVSRVGVAGIYPPPVTG